MPGLTRSLRARLISAFSGAGVLLGIAGLAVTGLETISFGHGHAGEHTVHHRHFYSGPHEHPGTQPEPEHDRDDHHHGHEAPAAPQERHAPRRTVTFSVAPALFQPVAASVLAMPLVDSAPNVSRLVLPLVARPALLLIPPRAPPFSIAVPDSLK